MHRKERIYNKKKATRRHSQLIDDDCIYVVAVHFDTMNRRHRSAGALRLPDHTLTVIVGIK